MNRLHRLLSPARGRFLLALLAALVFAACSGEDGPAGEDGIAPDATPPTVSLVSPASGDTIRDTLFAAANAVDNIAIDRVVFFLDGNDIIDDTTFAEDTTAPYEYAFDLVELGVPNGPHTVMARAYDVDDNQSDTPPVIVHTVRQVPSGTAVLRSWTADSTGWYMLPTRVSDDDSTTLDSLHNVRFEPERQAAVDSIRFYLGAGVDPDLIYDSELRIGIHSSDGIYPAGDGNMIASQTVAVAADTATSLDSTGWYSVGGWDLVLDGPFAAGERFHVSLSLVDPSDSTKIALGTALREPYPYPTASASSRWNKFAVVPGWQSLQQQFVNEEMTRELMIEVWVTYE